MSVKKYLIALAIVAAIGALIGAQAPAQEKTTVQIDLSHLQPELPAIPERRFVITSFGGVGDGVQSNTPAFRKAIAACHEAGGGQVIVPAGKFVTGPIEFTSNMALVLEKGSVILGSEDFRDYQADNGRVRPLIGGSKLTNVAIRGEGAIDGNGAPWWNRFRAERAAGVPQQGEPRKPGQPQETPRPKLVVFSDCSKVLVQGVTLKNSPQFHLVPQRCSDVTITDITVLAPVDAPNTDGIDPSSSRNVLIRHCYVDVGDDDVCFKSNPREGPTENVLVTDCTFKHGHGASVGSNVGGGIRNILVQHCTFEGTDNGIRIKSGRDRGGLIENITYRDLIMKNVGIATVINMFYFDKTAQKERETKPVTATTPIVRQIHIINVTVDGAKTAGEIVGLPEMPVTGVVIEKMHVKATTGMTFQDAKAVELRDVAINPEKGKPITIMEADVDTRRMSQR